MKQSILKLKLTIVLFFKRFLRDGLTQEFQHFPKQWVELQLLVDTWRRTNKEVYGDHTGSCTNQRYHYEA